MELIPPASHIRRSLCVDLVHQRGIAVLYQRAAVHDMGLVHMERLQDPCAVGDDEESAVLALLVLLDSLGNGADRVASRPESVSSRIARDGFKRRSCRISAFFFSPPEKPTFRSRKRRTDPCREPPCFLDVLYWKSKMRTVLSWFLAEESAADEVGEGDSRNFKRILEGEEHAELCTLVSGFFRDVLASEEDLTVCHMIVRVPHQVQPSVDFPAPFGPMSTWVSPLLIVKLIP